MDSIRPIPFMDNFIDNNQKNLWLPSIFQFESTVSSKDCCLLCLTGFNWFMDHWGRAIFTVIFLSRPARKQSNVPKFESIAKDLLYCPNIYATNQSF